MIKQESSNLAAERLEKLRRILRDRHIVSVADLHRELGVSPATIRRDLMHLDGQGEVRRVRGGAMSAWGRLEEPVFDNKETFAAAEKQRIAAAAFALIKPRDSVFLDGGSTVLALSRLLHDHAKLTVVTNSLRVAMDLAGHGPRLIVVGGEFRRLSQTFVGPLTEAVIGQLHVDIAFIGTVGVTAEAGLTTTDHQEAFTKNLIIRHANRTVLLADSSKIGRVSFARFGAADQVRTLITDKKLDPRAARELRRKKIEIVTV